MNMSSHHFTQAPLLATSENIQPGFFRHCLEIIRKQLVPLFRSGLYSVVATQRNYFTGVSLRTEWCFARSNVKKKKNWFTDRRWFKLQQQLKLPVWHRDVRLSALCISMPQNTFKSVRKFSHVQLRRSFIWHYKGFQTVWIRSEKVEAEDQWLFLLQVVCVIVTATYLGLDCYYTA